MLIPSVPSFPIRDSGSCDASGSGVGLSVSVVVGVDSSGHATLSTTGCSFSIAGLSVKFHGGARWVGCVCVCECVCVFASTCMRVRKPVYFGCVCDCTSVALHHMYSWLYNLFDGVIEDKLKDLLKGQVCPMLMTTHVYTYACTAYIYVCMPAFGSASNNVLPFLSLLPGVQASHRLHQ